MLRATRRALDWAGQGQTTSVQIRIPSCARVTSQNLPTRASRRSDPNGRLRLWSCLYNECVRLGFVLIEAARFETTRIRAYAP
jgi:hypothetical protein